LPFFNLRSGAKRRPQQRAVGRRWCRLIYQQTPRTVSRAKRDFPNQAWDAVILHGTQDVAGPFPENARWIEVPLMAKGGQRVMLLVPARL